MAENFTKARQQQKAMFAKMKGRTTKVIALLNIPADKITVLKSKATTKKDAFDSVPSDAIKKLNKQKVGSLAVAFTQPFSEKDEKTILRVPFVVSQKFRGGARAIDRKTRESQLTKEDKSDIRKLNKFFKGQENKFREQQRRLKR